MNAERKTLCKAERLNSKKSIETLFAGGAKSFSAFPLRVVFMPAETNGDISVSMLVSVPKKKFKRAVKRNRVKRQVREAYRKNKHKLIKLLQDRQTGLLMAFIFMDSELHSSEDIESRLKELLNRIGEKVEKMG